MKVGGANGKVAPGEGVIGMFWVLFVAGSRSIVWDDKEGEDRDSKIPVFLFFLILRELMQVALLRYS
jgi:hypothetical protein